MEYGKSLRIHLKDGRVTGLRHAEVYNWTGQAVACPRKRLDELKSWYEKMPGSQNTGVYFLFGKKEGEDAVYIGESEDTLKRIGQHLPDKDFWNEVVIFTNKDQNLTKAHAKYLEAELFEKAVQTERYEVQNGSKPTTASLAPAERAPMDEFIQNMRLVLGALGYRLLEPVSPTQESGSAQDPESSVKEEDSSSSEAPLDTTFYFEPRDAEASGALTDEGFLIHEGSTALKDDADSLEEPYISARENLIEEEKLVPSGDLFVFTEDLLCSSSSYAAAVIAGTMWSGPQAWKDEHGKSIKEKEEELKETLNG